MPEDEEAEPPVEDRGAAPPVDDDLIGIVQLTVTARGQFGHAIANSMSIVPFNRSVSWGSTAGITTFGGGVTGIK